MPSNRLNIANGIALGAENFVKSFQAASNANYVKRQQKNQVAIEALLHQLNDENTPNSKRATLLDEIQRLANNGKSVKDEDKLSIHLGLTPDSPFMQEEVDTGQTQQKTIGGETNPQVLNEPAPTMNYDEKVTKKRGDLSPFDMKEIHNRFAQKDEEARQERIIKVQSDAAEKSYRNLGYEPIDRGKDAQGNRFLVSQNKANDVKIINLNTMQEVKSLPQDFVSERENIASNRASSLPASVRVYEEDYRNKIDPETGTNYTPEVAHKLAVQKYSDYLETQGTARNLQNTKTNQEVTGTSPIQPAQQILNDRADNQQVESILSDYRKANNEWIKTGQQVKSIQEQKDKLFADLKLAESKYQSALDAADGDETDDNVKLALSERDRIRNLAYTAQGKFVEADSDNRAAYNAMNRLALDAKKSPYANKLQIKQDESNGAWFIDRLEGETQTPSNSSATRDATLLLANPKVREKIREVRDKKGKAVEGMTDEEILALLIKNQIVPAPPRQ
jgi:anti-sigma factor ChrR (cupin superfamily)